MTDLHLDTHVVMWLYLGEHHRIPTALQERIEVDPLRVSPMVRLELTYLNEIGRLKRPAHRVLGELEHSIGLVEVSTTFESVAKAAEMLTWTRDPFDRMIAANALASFAILATGDKKILEALGPRYTVWN